MLIDHWMVAETNPRLARPTGRPTPGWGWANPLRSINDMRSAAGLPESGYIGRHRAPESR